MALYDVDFLPWRAANRELAELANRQLAAMPPLLRQRLAGVPVCSPQCRVQHPVVAIGGRQFRHIVIGYAATPNLADTTLSLDPSGGDVNGSIYIVVCPEAQTTPVDELQNLVMHELVHGGEFIQNCGHAAEHCICFHQVARVLNEAGADVRVLQACESMRIAGYSCGQRNDCRNFLPHLCNKGRQVHY